ncbi:uncharacterized protein LOC122387342 [Amphibalanus amphitrite]|uniref:uncharacterized protein LOC122387342 n=1 Tax=Amphibalanus amphitrite TaxID=1232801 RepID=UPI001C901E4A|nr:uncharacterized protein LOC122387342 [Amphibalanus amphitrite]
MHIDECDEYMMGVEASMDEIRTKFAIKTKAENVKISEIHVKPLDAPRFSGNIRQYTSFKQDYLRLMTKQFGKDSYALRQCLSGAALETVKGVEDDYEEMFRRLDLKYGETRKLVDSIILDIKRLKPIPEGENKRFVSMVEVVERSWMELQRLGMSQEMDTTTMVTMVEKLLPRTQKREWVTKMEELKNSSTNCDSTFRTLLSYLIQEKRVIEYMDDDVRTYTGTNSKYVNSAINSLQVNPSDSISADTNPDTTTDASQTDVVKICNQIQNMTDRMETLLKNPSTRKFTGSKKKNNIDIENSRCWIHKTDFHSIFKCNAFLNSTREDKLCTLRQNGACFNCLQQGHIASSCPYENQCEKRNHLNEKCGKRHHSCLHFERPPNENNASIHSTRNNKRKSMLAVSGVICKDKRLTVIWDSGANISLITHKAASRLNLCSEEVELSITKVGNQVQAFNTKRYIVPLIDADDKCWQVHACIWYRRHYV